VRPEETAPESSRRSRFVILALAAACVVLLVAAAIFGFQFWQQRQDTTARENALSAAKSSALNLTSIDKNKLQTDIAAVLDGATGEFRQDFQTRAGDLEKLLQDNNVVSEGKVLDAGIVRSDRTSATALVVVDSTVRNKATPDGRVNSYRMKLTLEKVGDRWLTSTLEFVG